MKALKSVMRLVLAVSAAAMCALAFIWPFAVSPDPSHPAFRIAAMAAFVAFLVSLAVLLACKARRT